MTLSSSKLKSLLVESGILTPADFKKAEQLAKSQKKTLASALVELELIKDEQLGQLTAEEWEVPFFSSKREKIDEEVLNLIPEIMARSQKVIAFDRTPDAVKVAMVDPADLETKHMIEKRVGQDIVVHYITPLDLEEALTTYKADLRQEFQTILEELKDESLSREQRDGIVVKMVDVLIAYGYQNRSSDVHIEPYAKKIVVRFRIDGIMHDVLDIPKQLSEYILTRIKILAKLRTDEHRAAQDGKFRFDTGKEKIDIRVSIVPVTQGENVVMRLLSSRARQFNLPDLGFSDRDYKLLSQAIKNPHGMVLVTGPTGSGKTTTLYAILKILNKREVHVSTIEDPVEYDIEGVSQIQVNSRTNLSFAKGLRSIVRQDPDIIMVGEIRDKETANIAVNAAMTGHLVLSTLHANDTATTLPRLLDMEIEPFLVSSTVNIIIAQRLVRKICQNCRVSYSFKEHAKELTAHRQHIEKIFQASGKKIESIRLYKGKGCKICGGTGYVGRIGIFEIMLMNEEIKEMVMKNASSNEIMAVAKAEGMVTMFEDGLLKVKQGLTTIEEVLRVVKTE